ncbi:hypothetical protein [Oceanobacillus halophilus]|uniref:Glycine zipper domain-containing protein n=1 Tax=Oceanobacillus halophilus TaxID=930130 RepID=A0A494ZVT5_9BACI|nr:hypothetical protein [Oceanobacillus halophilus]RKQ29968.1 hypothetical protein D8M06_16480 [Oceanobacillus halophilus]
MGFLKKMWETQKQTIKEEAKKVEFEYIGGHPKFDRKRIKIRKGSEDGQIILDDILNEVEANLVEYQWGEQSKRSVGKAATGAIIGGVLTGGVGAIAGGAIGAKKKDDSVLRLGIEEHGRTYEVLLRADQTKYNEFTKKVL